MNLFKRFFVKKHRWRTTHTNKWQHSTREVCAKCGLVREIKTASRLMVKWVYSDGRESEEFTYFTDETSIK